MIHEMEREATPKFGMKLGIQMHLAGLLLSNTTSVLEKSGVKRARSTVHNRVSLESVPDRRIRDEGVNADAFRNQRFLSHPDAERTSIEGLSCPSEHRSDERLETFTRNKADPQPDDDMNPNQVAVDETVIRLNDELYWLYIGYQKSATSGWQTRASLLFRRSIPTLTTFFIPSSIQQEMTIRRKISC